MPSKRDGGGKAWQRRSPSPPMIQTPRGGRADQAIWGDKKHPNQTNKPNRVMEHTLIEKSTQSGERHHQAMMDHQRVVPGRYNPLEEVANMNKLEKSYSIKTETSVNRVDSNAIFCAIEARARQHRLDYFNQKLGKKTLKKIPRKRETPWVLFPQCCPS